MTWSCNHLTYHGRNLKILQEGNLSENVSPVCEVHIGYPEWETLGVPAMSLPFKSWWQTVTKLIFLYCLCSWATCQLSLYRVAQGSLMVPLQDQKFMHVPHEYHRSRSSCVKALQSGWVGTANRKYSRDMEGELENVESLLQWIWLGLAPFLWAYSCSVPSLQFFSLLLCQAQNPVILTLLLESLQWQTKAPHRLSTPVQLYPRLQWWTWKQELGPQTEDALRACSQSPRSFHSGQWKDRLFCDWTMSVLRGCVPTAELAKPHCVGPHWCWETGTWRPCLGKQRHWWSCKGEENEAMSKQSGFSIIISNSASCFIKPTGVVGISIELTVWTDLIAPVSMWSEPSGKRQSRLKGKSYAYEEDGVYVFSLLPFHILSGLKQQL